MFRSRTIRRIFLVSVGTIAGLPLSAPADQSGPALPVPSDQPAASRPATSKPATKKPAAKSPVKSSKAVPNAPAPAGRPGTVIAPIGPDPDTIPQAPPATGPAIPGLGNLMRPDGGIDLPGGVGIIQPGADNIGIQINTPGGPLEINIPRRHRASQGVDEPAGPDDEAPLPGGRAAVSGRASREFTIASRIFRARNYPAALRRLNRYLERDPGDRDLLQLRSLTNFSLADYSAAYRDALAAVADGDVWDWTTVRSLYRSTGEYTAEYRALEDYVSANPRLPEPAFLFAYQNLMIGNHDAARREFHRVAALDPANETARRLAAGERAPHPRPQKPASGTGSKGAPAANGPPAPPQGTTGRGPAVDLGQPAPLGAPEK